MKFLSLISLCGLLALIPACCKDNGCYQSCCPTTSCETPLATPAADATGEAIVEDAPIVTPSPKGEAIEIEEEMDELEEPKTHGDKEDLSSDKEDLGETDQSAQA